ncbi:MAG: alpha/beta hydrolase-fold protein [Bacteroidota bacterium]
MRITFLLLGLLISGFYLHAQESRDTTFIIDSEAFGGERKVHVHLPERYLRLPTDTFMVVYALDGHYEQYWSMAKSNLAYLVDNSQVLPMIIVGIHHDNRGRELIPANIDTVSTENNNGQAHLLQQHLREEVFPLIEATYRVNDKRAVVGHSRGGAFISSTLFSDQRDMFDAYIGISPAMHYMDNQIMKETAKVLASKPNFKKFLYCTYGTVGSYEDSFGEQVAALDSMISFAANESLAWRSAQVNTTTHWTVVIPSWNIALMEMTRQYSVDQYLLQEFANKEGQPLRQQAEAHLAAQEARLGWTVPMTARKLNYYANEFEELCMPDRALECYLWALRLEGNSYQINANTAYFYKQQDRKVEALRYFQTALLLLEQQKDSLEERRYTNSKEWIEEEIAELEGVSGN